MTSITPKNGREDFIAAQNPHTYWELNSTNLGTNFGRDESGNDNNTNVGSGDISTQEDYEGMNSNNNPPASGWMDIYIITDAAMLLYIPAGLTHSQVYGLFHNGGGTHAQAGFLRATETGVEICCTHNAGGTPQDNVIYEIPDADLPGWFVVSFQYCSEGGAQGDMGLWVNGVKVRSGTRTTQLSYGSGNPQLGDSNADHPLAASCLDPSPYEGGNWGAEAKINGSGILIANFTCDNPDKDNSSPDGGGDDWHEDYYTYHTEVGYSILYKTDVLLSEINNAISYSQDILQSNTNLEISMIQDLISFRRYNITELIDYIVSDLNITQSEIIDILIESSDLDISNLVDLIVLNSNKTRSELINILVQKSNTLKPSIDLISTEAGLNINNIIDLMIKSESLDKDSLIDVIIKEELSKKYNIDILTKYKNYTANELVDILISKQGNINYLIDQLIMNGLLERDIKMDTLLSLFNTKKEYIDANIKGEYDMDLLIDLVIGSGKDIGIRIDLLIQSILEQKDLNVDIDLLLSKFIENNIDIDVLIKETGNRQILFDLLSKETNNEANVLFDTYLRDINKTKSNLIDSMFSNFGIDKSIIIDIVVGLIKERNIDIDMILKKHNLYKSFIINTLIELSNANKNNIIDIIINRVYNRNMEINYTTKSILSQPYNIDFKSGRDTLDVNYLIDANIFNLIWINYAKPTNSSMFECTNNYLAAG